MRESSMRSTKTVCSPLHRCGCMAHDDRCLQERTPMSDLSDFSNTMSHYLAHKISHDRPLFTFVLSCLSLCRCICPCLVVGSETCDVRQQHLDPQPFLSKRTYKRQRLQESCVSQSFQVSANHSIEIFEMHSDFKSHQHRMDQNCWA